MKNVFLAILAALILFSTVNVNAAAADTSITVKVDGNIVQFPDAKPYIDENNRTLVPVRFVAEALKASVSWDAPARQVTVVNGDNTIKLTIDEKRAFLDGKEVALDTRAVIKENRTFVPLRFISELLQASVDWDGKARIVTVETFQYKTYHDYMEPQDLIRKVMMLEYEKRYSEAFCFYSESSKKRTGVNSVEKMKHYAWTVGFDYEGKPVRCKICGTDDPTVKKVMFAWFIPAMYDPSKLGVGGGWVKYVRLEGGRWYIDLDRVYEDVSYTLKYEDCL